MRAMTSTLADGWYPNPEDAGTERWWYRGRWTEFTRPRPAGSGPAQVPPPPAPRQPAAAGPLGAGHVAVAALVLAGVAILLEAQSVSVATGAGILFIGAVVAALAVVVALLFGGATWVRVVTVLVLVLCAANAVSAERDLDHRREEIRQIYNSP